MQKSGITIMFYCHFLQWLNERIDTTHKYFMDSKNGIMDSALQGSFAGQRPARERVGLVVDGTNTVTAVTTIATAEAAGVRQIWMIQSPSNPDTLTIFAAAIAKTSIIWLGTSIVPTYPRHPLALAQQALAINDISLDRFRLGIGPSHRPIIEGVYGLIHTTPLSHLREYMQVLRAVLWKGKVNHHGHFFNVVATVPHTAKIPLLTSTLGKKAFQLAGEISDGAISWLCPVSYLLNTGLPVLRKASASSSERSSEPPLVAHVLVALSQDDHLILEKGHRLLNYYTKLPFYAKMFTEAGFPITTIDGNGTIVPDALVDNLVISGNESTIAARFKELLSAGLGRTDDNSCSYNRHTRWTKTTYALDRWTLESHMLIQRSTKWKHIQDLLHDYKPIKIL
jgi:alkanesulfonate monooxygenase SsuD/methylene tetrahydromethanopterin reductase-like flavin-dependent oxidoreductase (luciferase family)